MPLVPYDPFRHLDNIRREMGRFFHETPFLSPFRELEGPRIDIYETDNEVVASCEIPGIEKKEDIQIDVTENTLSVSGTINKVHEVKDENRYFRTERYYGNFRRAVPLPAQVKAEETRASYRNGILEIRMPKQAASGRRRIDVDFNH